MEDASVQSKVKRLTKQAKRKRRKGVVIPTEKQLKGAANLIQAAQEGTPGYKALKRAGYSDSSSRNVKNLITRPGFEQALITMGQALDAQGVSQELLAGTHLELLTQRDEENKLTRLNLNALELAYKVRGDLHEKKETDVNVTFRWANNENETNIIDVTPK